MNQLSDFFSRLFDYTDWPPRWHCGKWSEFHGWLYIISDLLIWTAYFIIPLLIIKFIKKRHGVKFIKLYFLFAAFILACGATHLLDAMSFWFPVYRLNALVRFITGVISWLTVFYLYKFLPTAFSLKTQQQLEYEIEQRKKAEQKLKNFLEAAPNAMIITNDNAEITLINQQIEKIFGYSREELMGEHFEKLLPQELREQFTIASKTYSSKKASLEVSTIELVAEKKDGTNFQIEVGLSPFFVDDCIWICTSIRDITERKLMEEKLNNFNKELAKQVNEKTTEIKEIFERVSDAFVALDKNWCYTYVNNKAYENFNRPLGSLIGKYIWDEFPEGIGQPFYHAYHKAMETQEFIRIEEDYLPWDRWFENSIYPSSNGLSIYFKDITEKKKAEIEIQQSEAKYRTVIDQANDGILITNAEGFYIDANKSIIFMTGYSKEELLTMHSKDILFEDDLRRNPPQMERLLRDSKMVTQRQIKRKDGTALQAEISASVLPNGNLMGIIRDIAERKKIEDQIIKEKRLSDSIINSLPGIFYLQDITGKFIRWNNQFEMVTGYSAKEIVTMNPMDFFDEDKVSISQRIQEVFSNGYSDAEANIVTKSGQKIPYYFTGQLIQYEGKPSLIGVGINIVDRKKAEEKVVEVYKKMYTALNRITDGVISVDNDFRYTFINDSALVNFTTTRKETIGKTMLEIRPELEATPFWEQYQIAMQTKTVVELENYFSPLNIWASVKIYPSNDGLTFFYKDVTERKKVEAELIKSELRYRSLIEQASDAIFIVDPSLHYIDINPAGCQLTGYTKEDLLKLGPLDLLFPEDFVSKPIKIANLEKGNVYSYERRLKRKDGTAVLVEASSKRMDDGNVLIIVRDITERKKIEIELKKSEEKYRLLFDNNPLPMWMIDAETLNIIEVNEAAIEHYGYTKKEFLQLNIRNIRPPEDIEKIEIVTQIQSNDIRKMDVWNHLKKDGTLIKVEITSHDMNYQNLHTRLILANDVTDKIKAEEAQIKLNSKLRELYAHQQDIREEERKRIAREIHDELGQMITGLKMDMSWLKKKIIIKQPELTDKLNETIVLLDESVKTIRKISADLRPGILDDLGLMDALNWVAKDFEKRTEINCTIKNPLGEFECSNEVKVVLFRIFQETLTNVMRHAEATEVHTEISLDQTKLNMQITDNGKGFDVNNKTKTLGILGMKERIANINGELYISSAVGRGTTVTILVPC